MPTVEIISDLVLEDFYVDVQDRSHDITFPVLIVDFICSTILNVKATELSRDNEGEEGYHWKISSGIYLVMSGDIG